LRRCLTAIAAFCICCSLGFGAEGPEQEEEPFSGVRVRHAEIRGRVYISSEREEEEEVLGVNVHVRVTTMEDEAVICEAMTDANGAYELPMIDIGKYYLYVGRLRLEMHVEPEETLPGELPKIIIVMLPKEMAK